ASNDSRELTRSGTPVEVASFSRNGEVARAYEFVELTGERVVPGVVVKHPAIIASYAVSRCDAVAPSANTHPERGCGEQDGRAAHGQTLQPFVASTHEHSAELATNG